jgi:hypothetical protein
MASKDIWILGICISDRLQKAAQVQDVLTKFGCSIKTRLGLHETEGEDDSRSGLMILELSGDPEEYVKLENELLCIDGLEVKKMIFRG